MAAAEKIATFNLVDVNATPALAKLFRRVSEMTTLPVAAQRILQLVADSNSSASDLLAAVEGDPVLAAKVLRRVNSAFYGLRSKVADLRSAINLLGYREIRNLALTVYLTRMFKDGNTYKKFTREGLWEHSVAVANASRIVARTYGGATPDEAYLAGLLHDIGLILLDQYLPRHLFQVVDLVEQGKSTCAAERELLPFDHTLLGAYVATQWNFPTQVTLAIRFHHEPLAAEGPHCDMAAVVAVSNYLCSRSGFPSLGYQQLTAPSDRVLAQLEMTEAQFQSLGESLQETLRSTPIA
jgi:putative nucleotidyltransferase with HDIG domain